MMKAPEEPIPVDGDDTISEDEPAVQMIIGERIAIERSMSPLDMPETVFGGIERLGRVTRHPVN